MSDELTALKLLIDERQQVMKGKLAKWTLRQENRPEEILLRRSADQLQSYEREHAEYTAYLKHIQALLNLHPSLTRPFREKLAALVPAFTLGDTNTVADLQNYVVGPSAAGLIVRPDGKLDEAQSFRCVNYFSLLAQQRVRNNPQPELSSQPIDFTAARLPDELGSDGAVHSYWLHGDAENQLVVLQDAGGRIMLRPVARLVASGDSINSSPQAWRPGLPLHLFEDPDLHLPAGAERVAWLSTWHTEREWLDAIHACRYSNGVIGITEELSPVGDNIPGPKGISPVLLRYERRRRELVQADFHIFAADHWNFNARNFNPGGNHGAFFRISTHSIWMMAGAGVPVETIAEPYDSLNFASTILSMEGRPVPSPDRIVAIQ
jgi:hypothetical protein